MGVVLAFIAAWWLRGLLAIAFLVLGWNFVVPAGFLGKPGPAAGQEVVQQPQAMPMPRVVIPPATVVAPPVVPAAVSGPCRAVHDYGLDLKPEVATSKAYLRVQYWWDGQPERETFLPSSAAPGGRFLLTTPLRGHVWEFDGTCTDTDMKADVDGSIARRKLGGANTAGYVPWQDTGLFRPAVSAN